MAFCGQCGAQADDGAQFCPSCGQPMSVAGPAPAAPPPPTDYRQSPQQNYQQQGSQQSQQSDAEANKVMAVLSYLYILLFIPLCMGKHKVSAFVKYHLNQGIIFAVFYSGFMIIDRILRSVITVRREMIVLGIPVEYQVTPGWLSTILGLLYIPFVAVCIIGIINAVKGETKPLPVIGETFTVLK